MQSEGQIAAMCAHINMNDMQIEGQISAMCAHWILDNMDDKMFHKCRKIVTYQQRGGE